MSRSTAAVGGAGASNANISFIEFEHAVEQVRALRAEGQDSSPVMSQLISETKARLMRKFGLSDPRLARTVQYLEGDPRAPTPNEIRLIWENYKNAASAAGAMSNEDRTDIRFNRIKRGTYDRLSQRGQELLDRIQHELRGKSVDTMTGRFITEDIRELTHIDDMIVHLRYYPNSSNDFRIDDEDVNFMFYLLRKILKLIDETEGEAPPRAPVPSAATGRADPVWTNNMFNRIKRGIYDRLSPQGRELLDRIQHEVRGKTVDTMTGRFTEEDLHELGHMDAMIEDLSHTHSPNGFRILSEDVRFALYLFGKIIELIDEAESARPRARNEARNYNGPVALGGAGGAGAYAPADFGARLALMPHEPPRARNEARNYNGLRRPEMTEENINMNIARGIREEEARMLAVQRGSRLAEQEAREPEMTDENINLNIARAIAADRGVWNIGTRRIPPRGGSRKHRMKRLGKGKKSTIKRRVH
jgi:hypothetical protein